MLLDAGCHEEAKACLHGAATILIGVFAVYNIAAWVRRRERHLAVNAVLYTTVTAIEVVQTLDHVRSAAQ